MVVGYAHKALSRYIKNHATLTVTRISKEEDKEVWRAESTGNKFRALTYVLKHFSLFQSGSINHSIAKTVYTCDKMGMDLTYELDLSDYGFGLKKLLLPDAYCLEQTFDTSGIGSFSEVCGAMEKALNNKIKSDLFSKVADWKKSLKNSVEHLL